MAVEWRHPDEVSLGALRPLMETWTGLAAGESPPGALPPRRALDPTALPRPLLAHVKLLQRDGRGWYYRMAGTAFYELSGVELTGRYLADIERGPYARHLASLLETLDRVRRPLVSEARYLGPAREVEREVMRLVLPFRADAAAPDPAAAPADVAVIGAVWETCVENAVTSTTLSDVEVGACRALELPGVN